MPYTIKDALNFLWKFPPPSMDQEYSHHFDKWTSNLQQSHCWILMQYYFFLSTVYLYPFFLFFLFLTCFLKLFLKIFQ